MRSQPSDLVPSNYATKPTNASRGTANARHFYYALIFVITVLCGKLAVELAAP
nr:DUF3265 domain-containing protein [Vibrio vulnificus]